MVAAAAIVLARHLSEFHHNWTLRTQHHLLRRPPPPGLGKYIVDSGGAMSGERRCPIHLEFAARAVHDLSRKGVIVRRDDTHQADHHDLANRLRSQSTGSSLMTRPPLYCTSRA